MTRGQCGVKRASDLLVAVPLALLTVPLVAVLAIASAISFRANPFFVQPRVGRRGTTFTFIKIRSLPVDAPGAADKYEIGQVQNTRVGRFLRRHHLDELPQLWLVLTGSMSLVGPRPEMVELSSTFDTGFVARRTEVLPGCTGLWQISSAAQGLIIERPEFDEHYVDNWTLRLDLWILVRTVSFMLGGPLVKDIGQVPTWTGSSLPETADSIT